MATKMEKNESVLVVEALREMARALDRKANRTDLKDAAEVYRKAASQFNALADKVTGRNIIVE